VAPVILKNVTPDPTVATSLELDGSVNSYSPPLPFLIQKHWEWSSAVCILTGLLGDSVYTQV